MGSYAERRDAMSEQRWIKPRHRIVQEVARIILTPYIRL